MVPNLKIRYLILRYTVLFLVIHAKQCDYSVIHSFLISCMIGIIFIDIPCCMSYIELIFNLQRYPIKQNRHLIFNSYSGREWL